MTLGYIRNSRAAALYWIPHTSKKALYHGGMPITLNQVKKTEGIVMSNRPTAFHRYDGPQSWYCKRCDILITAPMKRLYLDLE